MCFEKIFMEPAVVVLLGGGCVAIRSSFGNTFEQCVAERRIVSWGALKVYDIKKFYQLLDNLNFSKK